MWASDDPLDDYALVHLASAAGDALVAIALADSIFFSLPVGEARTRVALYLGLTMAPLAVAGPLLVPLLDRGGFRRAISFAAGAGRAAIALYAAPRVATLLLFPLTFGILVLSRIHATTKNGLTMAYAPSDGLVQANARLARIAVVGALVAAGPGIVVLRLASAPGVLYLAGVVYAVSALLNLRLDQPEVPATTGTVARRGRVAELATSAVGTAALRAAQGFIVALLAFALRRGDQPTYWFGVLIVAGAAGAFLGDVVAPRLPRVLREEVLVFAALISAGAAALFAFGTFSLLTLAVFAGLAGMATEFGRLSFQSLMQRHAPAGAHGRVFVRYEVAFQLAWVAGAFFPAMIPIPFKTGIVVLAAFYLVLGVSYAARPLLPERPLRGRAGSAEPGPPVEGESLGGGRHPAP